MPSPKLQDAWILAPRRFVFCAAAGAPVTSVFLRHLIETRLHLPVSASAPSVITAFRKPLTLRNALFIVISQSGRSPDLVAATQSARALGARTVAIVNVVPSPVADAAEFVVPIEAGPEHSIAATKTVVGSMAAGAELIAELADDMALRSALDRLPDRRADTRLVRNIRGSRQRIRRVRYFARPGPELSWQVP